MKSDLRYLTLFKGNERYVFVYDAATRSECLRTLGRFASDPRLAFSWLDAATLSQQIRKGIEGSANRVECFGK